MKVVKNVFIVAAVLVVLFVVVGFALPTQYKVVRSITINAESSSIHEYVGDLNRWEEWTVWKEDDPTIETTFGDITSGVGASQSWVGEGGSGSLKIKSSSPMTGIEYDLFFEEGKYKSDSSMLYAADSSGTKVIWSMSGNMDMPVIGSYFAFLMDSMVGAVFERGLAKLKMKVEGSN